MSKITVTIPFACVAAALAAPPAFAETRMIEPGLAVTETRIDVGLPGSSTTVITSEDIARSPAAALPELLATQAGVQSRDLFGGGRGAQATVDVRGFGSTATNNTLFLIDGRRISPFDQGNVDFARIPLENIERIEISRGNAASVLYGDGAVGGVINIVTKAATRQESGASLEGGIGSLGVREANGSVRQSAGPVDVSAYGTFLQSSGFREHNDLNERTLVTEARHRGTDGDLFANIRLSSQKLELPGVRNRSQLALDPEGATTPFDEARQDDAAITLGGTRRIGSEFELLLDGGFSRRDQEGLFPAGFAFNDTHLNTWSLTPRVKRKGPVLGLPGQLIGGIDVYYYDYHSDRAGVFGQRPINTYVANQTNTALYAQQTVALDDVTDVSFGARGQRSYVNAHHTADPGAPGAFGFAPQLNPLEDRETNWAANFGVDRSLTSEVAVFGRVGRSFRYPNIDDRIGSNLFGAPVLTFDLNTQTSYDGEVGARYERGRYFVQGSVYEMHLKNEIIFDAVNFVNFNLPRTQRRGVELQASAAILPDLRARGAFSVTDARFDEGPNAGKVVPVISPYTASGTLEWDPFKDVMVTGVITYVSEKRMDNDQRNFQTQIPAYTLVDLRVNGILYDRVTWSAQVNNLFDKDYYNYALASPTVYNVSNAYPLPGQTFLFRLGMKL